MSGESSDVPGADATPEIEAEGDTGGADDWSATRGRRDRLAEIRAAPRRRRIALALAVVGGLAVAWVHWLGLFVAGALVGLVSESLPKALAAGLGVGVLVLALHVVASPAMGAGEFLALAPASYVTVAVALVAPLWGSLVRAAV